MSKVVVVADSIFYRDSNGNYWCKTIYNYDFWTRYLNVFDEVAVVSRTKVVKDDCTEGMLKVSGIGLDIIELPFMRNIFEYLKNIFKIILVGVNVSKKYDKAIFRLPSISAFMVLDVYSLFSNKFFLEIVADPEVAYSNSVLMKKIYTFKLRQAIRKSEGVSYVTQYYLQERYPADKKIESYYSTIDLHNSFFGKPKSFKDKKTLRIIHTSNSINNSIKGHDTLIKVLKLVRQKKVECEVYFIGDGDALETYANLANELEIGNYVHFLGLLPTSDKVREELQKADLFVLPSRSEGLPRSLIEAMAVGLPCIASNINGIPELLEEKYMFDPEDVEGFANKIVSLSKHPEELEVMSKNNIKKARSYSYDVIKIRRDNFYQKLKHI